ncbi:hypothetical protein G1K73_04060 [Tenacibaculum finnmarkense]|uniref:hypothetical protein n=1 Tax=Tenacibaculum finnmarkense TaxID=2781243 RepID=UPI001EFB9412|nr:hypothetical protein [Tenacibaculum finnmarkense]MCG8892931.1 hypothetical protein [Tenacibaculum finnmarkense]
MTAPKKRERARREPQYEPNESKLEKLTGKYTEFVIVGVLFFFALTILSFALFLIEELREVIITGLLTAFGSLCGYISGKKIPKKK